MNQVEYIMVLVSIIVGLGIAHILLGVGGIVDRASGHGETPPPHSSAPCSTCSTPTSRGGGATSSKLGPGYWIALVPACIVGVRSRTVRHHTMMAVWFCLSQIAVGFLTLPTLGF